MYLPNLNIFCLFCFSDENTRADLKKLPTLPTKVLKEHPSLAYWYAFRKCRKKTDGAGIPERYIDFKAPAQAAVHLFLHYTHAVRN